LKCLVLVVDDDPDSRVVARDALQREGFEVVEAEDGRGALEAASQRPPKVIFLDLTMPRMDGWEAVRRLRGGPGPRAHIVAYTAHALPGDREKALAAGFDDYLAKPCSPRDIVRKAVEGTTRAETGRKTGNGGST
jgi:two-component system, cell cycle response regulator DivK